jgi:hypothetical protein
MLLIALVFIAFILVTTLTRLLLIARLADTFGTRCPLVLAGSAVVLYFVLCIAWPTSSGVRLSFASPFAA